MILEEETYEKFGYYPSELKPKSHKHILAVCDGCGEVRVIAKNKYRALCRSCARRNYRHSEETKQKISEGHKGITPWNKGKHHTEATKAKISKSNKGRVSPNLGKQLSKEHKQKLREARKRRRFPTHHTKPELLFEAICKKYDLPFKYTGNGDFWIENINPDFVECNGKKIAIEIFGDYWHSPLLRDNIPYNQTYGGRKKTLKRYGWKLIVLWESDLKRADAEAFVLTSIQKEKKK